MVFLQIVSVVISPPELVNPSVNKVSNSIQASVHSIVEEPVKSPRNRIAEGSCKSKDTDQTSLRLVIFIPETALKKFPTAGTAEPNKANV